MSSPLSSRTLEPDQSNNSPPTANQLPPNGSDEKESTATSMPPPSTPPKCKLRKIPPIPIRRKPKIEGNNNEIDGNNDDDGEEQEPDDSSPLLASALGLNHIRTRSVSSPSPLRFSSSAAMQSYHCDDADKVKDEEDSHRKWTNPHQPTVSPAQGFKSLFALSNFIFHFIYQRFIAEKKMRDGKCIKPESSC